MEPVPDSVLIHSGMEIVYTDSVFCGLVGAESQDQLIGRSLLDLIAPAYHSDFCEQVARIDNEDAFTIWLNPSQLVA